MALKISAGTNIGKAYIDRVPIEPQAITSDKLDLSSMIHGDPVGHAVNWVYQHFICHVLGTPDKDLYTIILEPIAGDFKRIAANGDAWADMGTMMTQISDNMSHNAQQLVPHDWSGSAAEGFLTRINVVWFGFFELFDEVCQLLKFGFGKLSDASLRIVQKCADIIDDLLKKIASLFSRFTPKGILGSVIRIVTSLGRDFPYWDDVNAIIKDIQHVLSLHQTIVNLVDSFTTMLNSYQSVGSALKEIPNIDTPAGALKVGRDLDNSAKSAKDSTTAFQQAKAEYDKAKKDFDETPIPQ
ncbi:hypothetical protein [Actinocrispum wychmicini]|uniref:Uncharacterized protein n=1 Tax=Actinocrispum wychmicini TaxID=1213861 RepID=A0A4R2JCS1_9PSEU|nr:hypothetical protein [Actinocrispum wychmicini]TCO56704.1 hypothetical protein EV192_106178 [Actinocrispum wychmicini]